MNKAIPPSPQRQPVTIKTIAGVLGVSASTVSRALNADPTVSLKTRQNVSAVADELGYRRDLRGVNLRTGKTFALCALMAASVTDDVGDPATMHLFQGLVQGLRGSDFRIVTRPVGDERDSLDAVREAVEEGRYDGVIIDVTEPQDRRVRYLLEKRMPFVTFGRTELFTEHAYLDIDNEDAAYVATQHLARLGHQRIALVNPPRRFLFAQQRRKGYERAMTDAGLAVDEGLIAEVSLSASGARVAAARMLEDAAPPTAFVTANEVTTLGVLAASRELSRNRFADMHFVSRDGTRLFEFFDGAVSSCYYSMLEVGFHLTNALVRAIEGHPVSELQRLDKVEFIGRG